MQPSLCKSCKKQILWAVTTTGRRIPVDYDREIAQLWEASGPVEFDPTTMVTHFQTCPDATAFRTRKRKERDV